MLSLGIFPPLMVPMCSAAASLMSAGGCLPRVVTEPKQCETRFCSTVPLMFRRSQYRTYQRSLIFTIVPFCIVSPLSHEPALFVFSALMRAVPQGGPTILLMTSLDKKVFTH